ncbi:hypothetical protein EBZ39_05000 [bacterium]|nr:hypothetical protein [bacterium]
MAINCECVNTATDIANEASKIVGRRVSVHTVYVVRAKLAQRHCDTAFAKKERDWEGGCIRNPYLPTKMFGLTYGFSKARTRKLLKAVVAHGNSPKSKGAIKRWRGKTAAFAYV